jgi:glucoamylase
MPARNTLRIEVLAPARIHWSSDGWQTVHDTDTTTPGLGIHYADLPTADLPVGSQICFTFYWPQAGHWEGVNFDIQVMTEEPG